MPLKRKKVKMDNKNVFIAIALSMSVLFWAAFFESPRPVKQNTEQTQQQKVKIP